MVDMPVGDVSVEISADLTKLLDGLRRAKSATERFDKQATQAAAEQARRGIASAQALVAAQQRLKAAYDPLAVAMERHKRDLTDIERLQRRGLVSSQQAADYTRRAGQEFRRASNEARNFGSSARAASGGFDTIKNALIGLGLGAIARDIATTAQQFRGFDQSLRIITGSSEGAASELAFVEQTADSLGFRVRDLAQAYIGLTAASRGTSLEGKSARDVFSAVAKASAAYGLSNAELQGALLAVQQIMSKGTVSAEELRGQLGERLPGAFQVAARAMGVTTAELGKMLQSGEVVAGDFLPKFAAQLNKEIPDGTKSAAAGFNAFLTELDRAKVSLAEGGLFEGLTTGAKALADALRDMGDSGQLQQIGEAMGLLLSVAAELAPWLPEIAAGFVAYKVAALGAAAATTVLSGAIRLSPIGLIATAIGLGAAAYVHFTNEAENATDGQKALNEVVGKDKTGGLISGTNDLTGARRALTAETLRAAQAQAVLNAQQAQANLRAARSGVGSSQRSHWEADPVTRAPRRVTETVEVQLSGRAAADNLNATRIAAIEAAAELNKVTTAIVTFNAAASSGGGGVASDLGSATGEVSDYEKMLASLRRTAGDMALELQALNKNWPDSELDAARMKADLYADAMDRSQKMTEGQRKSLLGLIDQLVAQKLRIDDARRAREVDNLVIERSIEVHERLTDEIDDATKAWDKLLDTLNNGDLSRTPIETLGKGIEDAREAIERATAPAATYFDTVNERIDTFAGNISDAFGQAAQDILDLKNPLDVIRSLATDLAHVFQQEFVIDPLKEFVFDRARPAAADLINRGGGTGEMIGFNTGLTTATTGLQTFVAALQNASLSAGTGLLPSQGGTGAASDIGAILPSAITADPADLRMQAANDNLGMMASATAQATAAFNEQIPVLGQFGSGLMQVLSGLAGGGGGGGLLGTLLQIGGAVAGSMGGGFGGLGLSAGMQSAISTPLVDFGAMSAVMPLTGPGFADGGMIRGPGTGTSDSIPAIGPAGKMLRVANGEFLVNADATAKHRSLLEGINADRMPGFAEGGIIGSGVQMLDRGGPTFGDINITVSGAMDERSARQTGRVLSGEIHKRIAGTTRRGIAS